MKLEPKALVGSMGLDAVVDHLDPKAVVDKLEHFDPRALVELVDHVAPRAVVEKIDPRAVVEKLDARTRREPPKRRGRRTVLMLLVALAGAATVILIARSRRASTPHDTATGTDPNAKYDHPGYEDKSLGQAVNADMDLVDELVQEEHGDLGRAEQRFAEESAGAPALRRQASGDA